MEQYLFAIGLDRLLKGSIQTSECELQVNWKLQFYIEIPPYGEKPLRLFKSSKHVENSSSLI